MTCLEVAEMIESIGIPYAYRAFEEGTGIAPPFICYFYSGNVPEPADNVNVVDIEELNIELYTDHKNFVLEKQIDDVLTAHDLAFSREEEWIESEKMQMTIFTMEVLINE